MSDISIRAENVGKLYRLGQYVGYGTLRESLVNALKAPFRRSRSASTEPEYEYIWALKDVSFEIKQGEVVGIIGRNGAGKTTLLKVLSRITNPTEGYIEIKGRVGSLLEVGTGFHPELTGQENIYLNGAVLGMKKKEIDQKFNEIVEFAGVGKFIDTPLKRYSSGMQVRLAFAVAAHLEPHILLVDEVLAVGDVAFQQMCLGKMDELSHEGRTVLFISHDMSRIAKLCPRTILLEQGQIVFSGETDQAIQKYLQETTGVNQPESFYESDKTKAMCIRATRVLNHEGNPTTTLDGARPFRIEITYEVNQRIPHAHLWAVLTATDRVVRIWNIRHTFATPRSGTDRKPGLYVTTIEFPGGILNTGTYRVGLGMGIPSMAPFDTGESPHFEIVSYAGVVSEEMSLSSKDRGLLAISPKWTTETREIF